MKGTVTMLIKLPASHFQPVVTSRAGAEETMTGYRTGAATRRKILEALLAREPRTIRGLALAIGQHNHGVHQQVHRMQRDGLVVITPGRGRQGSSVMLTAAGRAMASDLKTLGDQEADTL